MIPENEKLYKLPADWQWTTLDKFAECLDNIRVPVNLKERRKRAGSIPYYGATGRAGWIDDYLTDEQLVLLGEDGAPFLETFRDKAYIIEGKAWINNHVHVLRSYFGEAGNIYLKNYLNEFDYRGYINGSTRWKLTQSKMKTIPIPLPPTSELERIVNITETLLNKLSRAKEIAQKIVDGYKLRRGKLLHETFKGELIKCNPQQMTIKSVCKALIYGTSKKSDKSGKVIVIRMGNLQGGEIDWSNLAYSNDEEEIKKYHLSAGDVLFNRTNSAELVGKTSIYRGEYPAIYAGYLIKLDYDPNIIIGDYLNYILNSPEAKDYCHRVKTDGVNQSNINAKRIGAFEIPVPNLEEQKEIVRHLDSLLTKEQQTKELAEKVLYNTKRMKKKILGMAFRGVI